MTGAPLARITTIAITTIHAAMIPAAIKLSFLMITPSGSG